MKRKKKPFGRPTPALERITKQKALVAFKKNADTLRQLVADGAFANFPGGLRCPRLVE